MKQNKILKSLNELSPELLAPEVAPTAGSTPGTSELVTAETKSTQSLQPVRSLANADIQAYREWGINE